MSEVYFCDTRTGEYIPIGIARDVEITSTDVTSLSDDVRIFNNEITLSLNLTALSRFDMSRLCGLTNNKRRFDGGRAIRWRKLG